MKILLALLLSVIVLQLALADTPADSVKVYFRVGQRQFDPSLRGNGAAMDSFINIVREAQANDNIDHICVSGYASPDGTSAANERLSRLRCDAIADYISQRTKIARNDIQTIAGGIAWDELRKAVAETPEVPSREAILDILDNTPVWIFGKDGKIVDGRKSRLMRLERGEPYRWMLKHLFPELRNAIALALFLKTPAPERKPEVSDVGESSESPDVTETSEIQDNPENSEISDDYGNLNILEISETTESLSAGSTPKPFYMAVKTNMLYDAALIPNIGVEFYLGKNLSAYGEWMYAWWENNRRHRYWEIYGGNLGLRWWFGRKAHAKPLTGHHLGIYAGALIFDFETGDKGYMGGKPGGTLWERCMVNAGVEYGYSLPIAKHFNIDFSIGLGYLGGNYIKYFPFDNEYFIEKEYKMRYFGPTKAEVSLVWLIGRGNVNKREGGEK